MPGAAAVGAGYGAQDRQPREQWADVSRYDYECRRAAACVLWLWVRPGGAAERARTTAVPRVRRAGRGRRGGLIPGAPGALAPMVLDVRADVPNLRPAAGFELSDARA